jgi:hypothetical protein
MEVCPAQALLVQPEQAGMDVRDRAAQHKLRHGGG